MEQKVLSQVNRSLSAPRLSSAAGDVPAIPGYVPQRSHPCSTDGETEAGRGKGAGAGGQSPGTRWQTSPVLPCMLWPSGRVSPHWCWFHASPALGLELLWNSERGSRGEHDSFPGRRGAVGTGLCPVAAPPALLGTLSTPPAHHLHFWFLISKHPSHFSLLNSCSSHKQDTRLGSTLLLPESQMWTGGTRRPPPGLRILFLPCKQALLH